MSNSKLLFFQDALERYTRNRAKLDLGIAITAGVPSILGSEDPKIIIERGLAGSQVLLSQTAIDDLLGVEGDVVAATAFGATAMVANNTFGFVLACAGQIESLDFARGDVDGSSALVEGVSSMPNGAFTGLQLMITPAGNIVGRYQTVDITAAATNALGVLEMYLRIK